jgi:V-type H+-transporting ATPase 21kDa proteolipid subunit
MMLTLLATADMLFTGNGESFNVGEFLETISPSAWASMGIGLCMGLSVIGAAWYVDALPCLLAGDGVQSQETLSI